jgi:hypothetical protein
MLTQSSPNALPNRNSPNGRKTAAVAALGHRPGRDGRPYADHQQPADQCNVDNGPAKNVHCIESIAPLQ